MGLVFSCRSAYRCRGLSFLFLSLPFDFINSAIILHGFDSLAPVVLRLEQWAQIFCARVNYKTQAKYFFLAKKTQKYSGHPLANNPSNPKTNQLENLCVLLHYIRINSLGVPAALLGCYKDRIFCSALRPGSLSTCKCVGSHPAIS